MKLESVAIKEALSCGNHSLAIDLVLAYFGESASHLDFNLALWRGTWADALKRSIRIHYDDGTMLSWHEQLGFCKERAYESMRSPVPGRLGKVTMVA